MIIDLLYHSLIIAIVLYCMYSGCFVYLFYVQQLRSHPQRPLLGGLATGGRV